MKAPISRRLHGSLLRGSELRPGCRIKKRWQYANCDAAFSRQFSQI